MYTDAQLLDRLEQEDHIERVYAPSKGYSVWCTYFGAGDTLRELATYLLDEVDPILAQRQEAGETDG